MWSTFSVFLFFFLILIFFRPIMVHFLDSKLSFEQDVLIIRDNASDSMMAATNFASLQSSFWQIRGPFAKENNSSHEDWQRIIDFKSPRSQKGLILLDSTHRPLNYFDKIPSLDCTIVVARSNGIQHSSFLASFTTERNIQSGEKISWVDVNVWMMKESTAPCMCRSSTMTATTI